MRTPEYIASLARLDVLAGCSFPELRSASTLLTALEIPAGEIIVRQNTLGRDFVIVASGELTVTRTDGGDTQLLDVVSAGAVLGEMALLHGVPRSATVTTLTPARVYAGSRAEFFALLDAAPSAAQRILAAAAERQRQNIAA